MFHAGRQEVSENESLGNGGESIFSCVLPSMEEKVNCSLRGQPKCRVLRLEVCRVLRLEVCKALGPCKQRGELFLAENGLPTATFRGASGEANLFGNTPLIKQQQQTNKKIT